MVIEMLLLVKNRHENEIFVAITGYYESLTRNRFEIKFS